LSKTCKVAVLGAAGGIGQPLALLLKQSEIISELALFDIVPVVKGVAVDISHISTPSVVTGFTKDDGGLEKTLQNADVVVIPAGIPRKPGMTRDDLFKINAGIVRDLAVAIAQFCPKAFICVISNPVNSTVPIVAEVLKQAGVLDPRRLFGVTTLDVVRAQTFCAEAMADPQSAPKFQVPVIGGHSGVTILPLLSQAKPSLSSLTEEQLRQITTRIQFGGDEVVKAKDGAGSATLSMAAAGYRFVSSLLAAKWGGKAGVVEMSYVSLQAIPADAAKIRDAIGSELDYFSVPVELGSDGVERLLPFGEISSVEKDLLQAAVPELQSNISKGVSFVQSKL